MQTKHKTRRKPDIRISISDHARLSALAEAVEHRNPDMSRELLAELDRARLVADGVLPGTVVRMGSRVTYRSDSGETRTVTLVFPADADIAEGRISVLTPIGAALIGLSAGQTMNWTARDGRVHELDVLSVEPAPAKADA